MPPDGSTTTESSDNNTRCTGSYLNKCPDITGAIIREDECYFCSGRGTNGSSLPGVAYTSKRVTSLTLHDAGIFVSASQSFYLTAAAIAGGNTRPTNQRRIDD